VTGTRNNTQESYSILNILNFVFDLVIYRLLTRKRANITNELSYKYDGEKYYRPATLQVIDYDEIIVTTDYGVDVGRITQYFVRLLD
jgi:hypothetical protein